MTRLSAQNLIVTRKDRRLLDGVSATFGPGRLTGLIGPNGAGKTTFLKALLGLTALDGGAVALDGASHADLGRSAVARRIGYLAQGAPCHWPMTVARVVELGLLANVGADGSGSTAQAVADALAATGTSHLKDRNVTSLSGGERTLVMVARCLAGGAPLLLADGPITGLDPRHQIDVMEILRGRVTDQAGTVAVLHDLTLAAQYCDRLILMNAGRIVADGPPAQVLTPDNLAEVYRIEGRLHDVGGRPIIVTTPPRSPHP